MNIPFPGGWRYGLGALAGWVLFLALLVGVIYGRAHGWPVAILAVMAVSPAIIVTVQFTIAWRLVAREDEFVRGLFARRMLAAAGSCIVIAIAWSCLELIGAPHLPAWLLYPLLWTMFSMMTPLISRTLP